MEAVPCVYVVASSFLLAKLLTMPGLQVVPSVELHPSDSAQVFLSLSVSLSLVACRCFNRN
jgi:hypothetical protein